MGMNGAAVCSSTAAAGLEDGEEPASLPKLPRQRASTSLKLALRDASISVCGVGPPLTGPPACTQGPLSDTMPRQSL